MADEAAVVVAGEAAVVVAGEAAELRSSVIRARVSFTFAICSYTEAWNWTKSDWSTVWSSGAVPWIWVAGTGWVKRALRLESGVMSLREMMSLSWSKGDVSMSPKAC